MSKYHSIRTEVDGISFASKREAAVYAELKLLERASVIRQLELQPRFKLMVNGVKVCSYVADFAYFEGNAFKVVDVKGMETPIFKLKMKLMKAVYPGVVVEIRK